MLSYPGGGYRPGPPPTKGRRGRRVVFLEPEDDLEDSEGSEQEVDWCLVCWVSTVGCIKERGPTVVAVLMLAILGVACTLSGWLMLGVAGALNNPSNSLLAQAILLPLVGLGLLLMALVVFRSNWYASTKVAAASYDLNAARRAQDNTLLPLSTPPRSVLPSHVQEVRLPFVPSLVNNSRWQESSEAPVIWDAQTKHGVIP